jgi:hypothetical protein
MTRRLGGPRHRKDIYQRIFISYPISKNLQKGYFLSFFGAGYFEDIISYFKGLQNIISISYPMSFFQRSVPEILGLRGNIFPLALPFLMYSHVEYFNYSLHALRTITPYSARVYSCVYKTMCYLERSVCNCFIKRAAAAAGTARLTHTWSDRAWYTSSLQKLGDIINMKR